MIQSNKPTKQTTFIDFTSYDEELKCRDAIKG